MQIAITGGTGFLGRHLIDQLIHAGHDVRAWYRGENPPAFPNHNPPTKPTANAGQTSDTVPQLGQLTWVPGDLDDPDAANRLIVNCQAVVHAALAREAVSFMAEPVDPIAYYETNVVGSLRLLHRASQNPDTRFVFVSSGAVHEKVLADRPLDEDHPLRPASLYGACKASVETLVHSYGLSGKLNATTVRPVSVVGIDEPLESSKWYELIQKIKHGETVNVSGGGKVVTVSDLANAIVTVLETDRPIAGQTFNCATGFVSHFKLASIAKEFLGSSSDLQGEEKQAGNVFHTDKLRSLGMKFSDESAIAEIVERLAGRT